MLYHFYVIIGHYFVGRVEAIAKPDFYSACLNQRYECHWTNTRVVFAMIPRMVLSGFANSTRPTIYYDDLSIRYSIILFRVFGTFSASVFRCFCSIRSFGLFLFVPFCFGKESF